MKAYCILILFASFLLVLAQEIPVNDGMEMVIKEVNSDSAEEQPEDEFKYFNNSYAYVTFRRNFLDDESGTKGNMRQFWNKEIMVWLRELVPPDVHHTERQTYIVLDVNQISIYKVYSTYMIVDAGGHMNAPHELCIALKQRDEILGCEYLDKRIQYGKKASLEEMASFRSKVKK